jgi:hypothetical protein
MYYINKQPRESGNYGNPMGQHFPGAVGLPDGLLSDYISAKGFVIPVIENGEVVSLEANQEALAAYEAANQPDLSALESEKESEIREACHSVIVSGIDVTLSDGTTGHFALEETDQINLTTAYNAVQTGAAGYPYHADGQLCKMYPAADIIAISEAATAHKLYHLTYCNHLLAWARRAKAAEDLAGITYGAELPEDLAANMQEVMNAAAL